MSAAKTRDFTPAEITANAQRIRLAKARQAKQALAQAAQVGRDVGVQDGVDYGPGCRLERGEIVREDRADIEDESKYKRQIRGARRSDSIRKMFVAGEVDTAHLDAVERFRADVERAAGARDIEFGGIRSAAGPLGFGPGDHQVNSLTRANAAMARIPEAARPAVAAIVIGGDSIEKFSVRQRMRRTAARDLLVSGLDALADFYTHHRA